VIDLSVVAADILSGNSYQMHYRLQSWLAGECIAEDIPAENPVETQDNSLRVPERLTFRVPLESDGVSWVPTSFSSPLGTYGQMIRAQVGISVGSGDIQWIDRGTYLLNSTETEGSSIAVECLGILHMLNEAELATEFQPTAGSTLGGTLRQLIEPGIIVDLDDAPTDRAVPTSAVTWSDNRLECIYTILDAWPARMTVSNEGFLVVTEMLDDPEEADVEFAFSDGVDGTVVEFVSNITREGAFNLVVAEGVYDDDHPTLAGMPIVHSWYDVYAESPYSLFGNFSPYFVPFKFQSPLLNDGVSVLLAAEKKMIELRRKASRTVKVKCVPHPALQLGDAVSVTSTRLGMSAELGRIDAFDLPHSADGGAMDLTIRLMGFS
jgi:hypothetical protein